MQGSRVGLKSNVEGFGTADGLSNVHTAMHVTCRVAHTVSPESNAFKVLTRRSTTTSGTDLPDLSIDHRTSSLSLHCNLFHPSFRTSLRGNKSYRRKWQNGLNSSLKINNLQFRRIGGVESQTSRTGTRHTLLTPGNAEILVQKLLPGKFFGSGGLLQRFCWGQYQKNVMHGLSSVKCWLDCLGIINREWLSLIRRATSGCHDASGSGKTQRFLSKAQQLPAGGNSFLSCCGSDVFSRTIQIKKFLVGWRAHSIKWLFVGGLWTEP